MNKLRPWVLKNCFSKSGKQILSDNFLKKKFPLKIEEIFKETSFLKEDQSLKIRLWYILNGENEKRKCPLCGSIINDDSKYDFSVFCSVNCRAKFISTNITVKNKRKQTCKKRYGGESPFHSSTVQQKVKDSVFEKYGVNNISQVEEIKEKSAVSYSLTYQNNKKETLENYKQKHNELFEFWNKTKSIDVVSKKFNISFHHIYKILGKFDVEFNVNNVSSYEIELQEILKSWNVDFVANDRRIIKPKELDIFIPSINLAIEINGIYHHSIKTVDRLIAKKNHFNKTEQCESQGIQLFHIFDNEWIEKKDIWISMIRNKLNLGERIFSRKCKIVKPEKSEVFPFLEKNHIQGKLGYFDCIGLEYKGELVSIMTFIKRQNRIELGRFCSKLNTNVIGSFSKLLKNSGYTEVYSFGNRRWTNSLNNVYEHNGFDFLRKTQPNYFYTKNGNIFSRINFQKHKLKDKLETFNSELSEFENMFNNGYSIIFDSGNLLYKK